MNSVLSIFPKFYRALSLGELAAFVTETGLDTTNLTVREGYWCEPATLEKDVPRFVKSMNSHGLKIHFATTGYTLIQLLKDPTPLQILADIGIREFRMGYFGQDADNAREAFAQARQEMEQMADLCARHKIRAVYQVHHGTLIPNATAAYFMVRELPEQSIGIELDPGNQTFEGSEDAAKSVSLLGNYLTAFGIKDTRPIFDPARKLEPGKGWGRDWCGIDEGQVNWHEVIRPLAKRNWSGTFVFMPFYHEHDSEKRTTVLKREVAYLRQAIASVTG